MSFDVVGKEPGLALIRRLPPDLVLAPSSPPLLRCQHSDLRADRTQLESTMSAAPTIGRDPRVATIIIRCVQPQFCPSWCRLSPAGMTSRSCRVRPPVQRGQAARTPRRAPPRQGRTSSASFSPTASRTTAGEFRNATRAAASHVDASRRTSDQQVRPLKEPAVKAVVAALAAPVAPAVRSPVRAATAGTRRRPGLAVAAAELVADRSRAPTRASHGSRLPNEPC